MSRVFQCTLQVANRTRCYVCVSESCVFNTETTEVEMSGW